MGRRQTPSRPKQPSVSVTHNPFIDNRCFCDQATNSRGETPPSDTLERCKNNCALSKRMEAAALLFRGWFVVVVGVHSMCASGLPSMSLQTLDVSKFDCDHLIALMSDALTANQLAVQMIVDAIGRSD